MNYYPHHIGDFNNATRHLTRVERALYRELIELYYDIERPLPANDFEWICKRVLACSQDERDTVKAILKEFFVLNGDGYQHSRCDEEIKAYRARLDNASKAGKASAQRRLNKRSTGVKRTLNDCATNQEPRTKNQVSKENGAVALPAWVPEDAWKAWLEVRSRVKAPNTARALELALRDLDQLRTDGNDPRAVLERATMKGWRGLFPVSSQSQQPVKVDL